MSIRKPKRKKKKKKPTVFKLKIRQGTLMVSANSEAHAERQAQAFERDVQRYWVRAQTEWAPGLFILGSAAKAIARKEKMIA